MVVSHGDLNSEVVSHGDPYLQVVHHGDLLHVVSHGALGHGLERTLNSILWVLLVLGSFQTWI